MTPEGRRRLRQWRGRNTQEQAAKILGVSATAYCRWETGTREIRPVNYAKIAWLTGIPMAELLPATADAPPPAPRKRGRPRKQRLIVRNEVRDGLRMVTMFPVPPLSTGLIRIHGKPHIRVAAPSRQMP
ncbi:helix-turn-helix domain-containing protein [Sinorhizobium meliloti]|nr:helix-turn-helix domain-containing protein [Sinorhizobium meliloti]